ncbi:MAG TPA: glycosyltransferase [Gaiellaceae bacterium]|nr:glycosyltransferase [Gaiellaceae bacterium]
MKIVHLVIGGDVAGGQIVALRLARASRAHGHDASFVSPSGGAFVELARGEGFDVDVVALGGAFDVPSLVRLARLLRSRQADVLHTHAHFSVNVLGRLAGRIAGARVVAHMHIENAFRTGRGRRAQVLLDNATVRLCAAVVAVSDATRESLSRQGYPARRLITIHNGIEPPEPVEPMRLADAPTVIEVARLADSKGQRRLIQALARLARRDVVVVLVGRDLESGGCYESELKRIAEDEGVSDRVIFAGYRDDVAALLAGCDIVCLPSEIEGLPLALLEAMARGRPVVATAVGGTPELVVDGETGVLVPPGDVDALVRALDGLLADPALARALGEAGRRRVAESFRADVLAERVLRLYDASP